MSLGCSTQVRQKEGDMLSYRTTGYNGYASKYSPFYDNKIAVATSANYGLVGNGKLCILSIQDDGQITQDAAFETQDGLFDLAWSEVHENQVVVASGDGSLSLFDITLPNYPIKKFAHAHDREIFSVYWNLIDKTNFCSSSWDGTVKVWTPMRDEPLLILNTEKDLTTTASPVSQHQINHPPLSTTKQPLQNPNKDCIYQATFSPHDPSILISVNSSSHCHIWDTRSPHPLQIDFIAHSGLEILTCDYNKYRKTVIATAGVDKSIKIWDLRMIQGISQPASSSPLPSYHKIGPSPLNKLIGHDFAIRKIAWSPHQGDTIMSTSYDMTVRIWQDQTDDKARFLNNRLMHGQACKNIFGSHKEFAIGCDWSLWGEPGWVVSTGWDEMVYVWDTKRKFS